MHMRPKIKHMQKLAHAVVQLGLLLFFSVYALSPIYVSAQIDHHGKVQVDQGLAKGIVWVEMLLSTLSGQDPNDADSNGVDDHMHVLVKKKRAVIRESISLKPLFSVVTLSSVPDDLVIVSSYSNEISHDLRHHESEGYYTLNSGLSPPASLS